MDSIWKPGNNQMVTQLIAKVIVVFCCFPIHECAHAWMAAKLGDPTGKRAGRITLNPFVHLDLWGTVMLAAFGMGYAKPVPVNPNCFRKPKRDLAIVSLAGPVSSLVMAFVFLIAEYGVSGVTGVNGNNEAAGTFVSFCLRYAAYINLGLAVFNLIPIPPLDGYHVLLALSPDRLYHKAARIEKYSVYALLGLFLVLDLFWVSPLTAVTQKLFSIANGFCGFLFNC